METIKSPTTTASFSVTISDIQKIVCEYFCLPYEKVLEKTGRREIVKARQIIMHLSKLFTKTSLKTNSEHFGMRNHTTVMHARKNVKRLMDSDPAYQDEVKKLTEEVKTLIQNNTEYTSIMPGVYGNDKGEVVRVQCIAQHTENTEALVIFRILNITTNTKAEAQPLEFFLKRKFSYMEL